MAVQRPTVWFSGFDRLEDVTAESAPLTAYACSDDVVTLGKLEDHSYHAMVIPDCPLCGQQVVAPSPTGIDPPREGIWADAVLLRCSGGCLTQVLPGGEVVASPFRPTWVRKSKLCQDTYVGLSFRYRVLYSPFLEHQGIGNMSFVHPVMRGGK
jgi:hypothetical protein